MESVPRLVCLVFVACSVFASTQVLGRQISSERFFSDLSCRSSQIIGGQNNTGAILSRAPDDETPLRFFQISDTRTEAGPTVQLITPIGASFFSNRNKNALNDSYFRFYWSQHDDFAVWRGYQLWSLSGQKIVPGSFPRFDYQELDDPFLPILLSTDDVIPEHVLKARFVGAGPQRRVMELDWNTRQVQMLSTPNRISNLAWSSDDHFIRLSADTRTKRVYLDLYEDNIWKTFAKLSLPVTAKLLLFRRNLGGDYEAVVRWNESDDSKIIAIVNRNSAQPRIIATGDISRVFVSPNRSHLYGFSDSAGGFHKIADGRQEVYEPVWLDYLTQFDQLEEFYLMDGGKYAAVKGARAGSGIEIAILRRQDRSIDHAYEICTAGRIVHQITVGARSHLFIPTVIEGNRLIVYLHDEPFTSVGVAGDWMIDLLTQTGNPVLAINYPSSIENSRGGTVRDTIFNDELAGTIELSRKTLGTDSRKLSFVTSGFGSLVGLSSISSKKFPIDRLLIISGMVNPQRLFSGFGPELSPTKQNYLARTARQMSPNLEQRKIIEATPNLRILFLHGSDDLKAPLVDVRDFAKGFNALGPSPSVQMKVIDGMGHSPSRRHHYQEILTSVSEFLAGF